MKVLLLDPQLAGISGDMCLASLLDIGLVEIIDELENLFPVKINATVSEDRGIRGVRLEILREEKEMSFEEIKENIRGSKQIVETSYKIIDVLSKAEEGIHGERHFHDAWDLLVDVVGFSMCIEKISPEIILSLPPALGTGIVESPHGTLPVPSPATLEILRILNFSTRRTSIKEELTTPTGASLLSVSSQVLSFPEIYVNEIGYGLGWKKLEVPNVFRSIVGESIDIFLTDQVFVLETNIDDVSPEILSYTMEKLLEKGAKDVCYVPIYAKKNRPAYQLQVICSAEDLSDHIKIISKETGSLGIRILPIQHRWISERKIDTLSVKIKEKEFDVRIKRSQYAASIEYEDAKKISEETGIPLREVFSIIERQIRKKN
ncbi:MAG: nickel pincer cofactor biosynthesis protein LarC [Candidatus Hydrothermarchaeota archaeon]